jgi:hypothetical protein
MLRGSAPIILHAISILCLLFLGLLWRYSGVPYPSSEGASNGEATAMWLVWALIVAIPALTGVTLIIKFLHSRPRESSSE